ncbi:MAG: ompB-2 [Acidimicrobiales bacterium]|nr:ompB-2 [Acidimicrobiales bacterium]
MYSSRLAAAVLCSVIAAAAISIAPSPALSSPSLATTGRSGPRTAKSSPHAEVTASAASLDFGRGSVGTTTPKQYVTLRNTGDDVATFNPPTVTGPFTVTNGCAASLAPGASCQVGFAFKPTAVGAWSSHGQIQGPQASFYVALYGRGDGTPYPLTVSPAGLDFGDEGVGTTSATQLVTITNTSPAAVSWTFHNGLPSTTSFTRPTNTCASGTLAANASCSMQFAFTPKKRGVITGTATVTLNVTGAGALDVPIKLAGFGLAELEVTPTSLSFGDVVAGQSSSLQAVLVRNTSTHSVSFAWSGGIPAGSVFQRTGTCAQPQLLAAGSACFFTYSFGPPSAAPYASSANLTVSVPGTTYSDTVKIMLAGHGVATASDAYPITVTPTALSFGEVPLGLQPAMSVRLHNVTGSAVTFGWSGGGFSTNNGFSNVSGSCLATQTLAAASSCSISFAFNPKQLATVSNSTLLNISPSGKSTLMVPVNMSGIGVPSALTSSPTIMNFGSQAVGTTSADVPLVVTNHSLQPVSFTSAGGGFNVSNGFGGSTGTCPATLAAGGSCADGIYRFAPQSTGAAEATTGIGLPISAPGTGYAQGSLVVTGFATGNGPVAYVSPLDLDFGPVAPNQLSGPLTVTLYNGGSQTITAVTAFKPANTHFTVSGSCASVPPGGSCPFQYRFQDSAVGGNHTTVYFTSSGGNFSVSLDARVRALPTTAPDAYNASTGFPLGVSNPAEGVLANDAGIGLHVSNHTYPTHGTLVIAAAGTFKYTPNAAYTGPDSFTYSATDSIGGASNTATVTISVKPHPTPPNAAFTKASYQDFLHRQPSSSELATAVAALGGGQPRGNLVTQLASSPEWVSVIVNQLYLDTLGRNGEPGGVAYWTDVLRKHQQTVAQVTAFFFASDEYFKNLGGNTVDSWLTDVFWKMILRAPTAAELTAWKGEVAAHGRTDVAGRLFQSDPSCRRRVANVYQSLLDRAPEPGGLAYWAIQVAQHGDIALAANLGASDEYFQRAQSRYP